MKDYIIKEDRTNNYLYSCISLIMVSPLLTARGIENKSLLMLFLGILATIISISTIRGYHKRKKQMSLDESFLIKLTDEGIQDNPFFGKERLIKWSNISTVKKDVCILGKKICIELKNVDDFYTRNKKSLRLIEKLELKYFGSPYQISLYATDSSLDEIIDVIKSRIE